MLSDGGVTRASEVPQSGLNAPYGLGAFWLPTSSSYAGLVPPGLNAPYDARAF